MNDATRRLVLRLKGPLERPGEPVQGLEERAGNLRRTTESVLTLPTLPVVATRLLQMVDDPNISSGTFSKALSEDQALTARILKLANSSYYGFPRSIGTVNLAVVVLGFDTIKDLVLSVAVMDLFRSGARDGRFDLPCFWEHSLRVAAASRRIARLLRWRAVGESFTAGIIHDIGKIVMYQYQPREFDEMVRRVVEDDVPPLDAELDVLGATHAEVGAWLAEKWNLPTGLVEAVRFHHAPGGASQEHAAAAALLHLSDYLSRRIGFGNGFGPEVRPELHPDALRILVTEGLIVADSDLDDLEHAIAEDVEKVEGLREAFQ